MTAVKLERLSFIPTGKGHHEIAFSGDDRHAFVSNRDDGTVSVIEVKSPDRLGLLYLITRTLSALDLDIASARIATEIDQALDTFYVHDRSGRKLDEPAGTERIRGALEQALTQPL